MNSTNYIRSPNLLDASRSRLVIVDMQERLLNVIPDSDALIEYCRKLILGAEIVAVPVDATEQYPKGLGSTVAALAALVPDRPAKLRFSSAEVLPWVNEDHAPELRHQVVLAGIEAHICVLQTAFDLLAAGFEVFVVADAVQSRNPEDKNRALNRLAAAGANVVSVEMVLFEWCEVAGTDTFRQISKLVTG